MMEGFNMENTNTPAILDNDGIAVLSNASEVLTRNQVSVQKASEIGKQIMEAISVSGMSDDLDEKCNTFLVKVNTTLKLMNERRSPITQLFTQVAKQFTTLENELKEGQTVKFIQQSRNDWAAKKAAEKAKAEAEARRKLLVENEKVEIRKKVALDLNTFFTNQLNTVIVHLNDVFNKATLENIESMVKNISSFSPIYEKVHYNQYVSNIQAMYLTKEEVSEIVDAVKEEMFRDFQERYSKSVIETKFSIEDSMPLRKKDLIKIAELEKENAEEAERLKALALENQKAEAERQRIEAAEKAKASELQINAQAEADKMNNLFAATEAAVVSDNSKAQVRTSLKITVTHQSAWVEIFTHFMQIEGMKLGIDELGKKSLNQMKAACEKHATKTGELINSKYIKYEEDFTAVNKA